MVLLNRSCCKPGWPQEGIYVTLNSDLSQPAAWRPVQRILSKSDIGWSPGYYPQVLGLEDGQTDNYPGEVARLCVHGRSIWEIVFDAKEVEPEPEPKPEPKPDYCLNADGPCDLRLLP